MIRFQAVEDPEYSLVDLHLPMRNMRMNGSTRSRRSGRGTAKSAGSRKYDKSEVKFHGRGQLGHYNSEYTKQGVDDKSKSSPKMFSPGKTEIRVGTRTDVLSTS